MTAENTENTNAGPEVQDEAQRIVDEGAQVRERIRQLMLKALRERKMEMAELGEVARQVMHGAAEAIRQANQGDDRRVLREVVSGVEDGYAAAIQSAKLAVEEAAARGQAFAEADLKRAMEDLKSLESMFIKTLTETAGRFGQELSGQLKDMATHAQRAGSRVGEAAAAALRAMGRDPLGFAKQSAAASAQVTMQSTGMLLQAMAGFLQAAGEALAEKDRG